MDRIYNLLNNVEKSLAQKTYDGIKRSDLKDSDFLFPETRSFPIVTPADVPDAINSFGRMKGSISYDSFLKKLYSMCKSKGPEFVAALPKATKEHLGIKATMLPVPTVEVGPAVDPNAKPPLKPELVDKKTNDDSLNSQKEKINQLKTKNPNEQVSRPTGDSSVAVSKLQTGDNVKNINTACMHYGSEGIVESIEEMPENIGYIVGYRTTNAGASWTVDQYLRKTEDQLALVDSRDDYGLADMNMLNPSTTIMDYNIEDADDIEEDEDEDEMEEQFENYKNEFIEMNIVALKSIVAHANRILDSLDDPKVKENLTESWLQGKIAIVADYMSTIRDFVILSPESDDDSTEAAEIKKKLKKKFIPVSIIKNMPNIPTNNTNEVDNDNHNEVEPTEPSIEDSADSKKQGLWDNIRKKKEREGKNYRPAKPGDKDRPDPKQWKKLT